MFIEMLDGFGLSEIVKSSCSLDQSSFEEITDCQNNLHLAKIIGGR
jgi:hypothetical protein